MVLQLNRFLSGCFNQIRKFPNFPGLACSSVYPRSTGKIGVISFSSSCSRVHNWRCGQHTVNRTPNYPLLSSQVAIWSSKKIRMFSAKTPCNVGDPVAEIETPTLVLCLDKLETNLGTLKEAMARYPGVAFRPHVKAHKCPVLGQLQMKSGACGVCCQTLTEAEAMVEGGLQDVFISNEVIGRKKLLRLAALARTAKVSVCVDSEGNIEDLSKAAGDLGVTLDLVIEVNVGQDRCGVEPGQDVARLAKKIQSLPQVNFKGIQCYNGWNQHIRKASERKAAVELVAEKGKKALQALKEGGFDCPYVTGGGTGTFHFEAGSGVFTEVQPGSYLMMDVDYNKNLDESEKFVSEFQQSLYIISTVQSVAPGDRAVLDTGLKGVSLDSGVPTISGAGDLIFHNGGDEHGIVRPSGDLKVGDQVWLVPGHCDPTVNMYQWIVGLRDGHVECVWPVSGRGPGV
ncbi:D-threonine aldolase [Aplysia californica]|uniref:D-threonine aldolase n=1 Tax=Aplysia californica TaxID=6500 RepID=A0ABM0K1G7_APLCA|nr:D-threonine aldolase [Aplysia californica]